MKFLEFQKKLANHPLFSIHDLKIIFRHENINTIHKQIMLWNKQAKIFKIKNGLYVLSSDYSKKNISPEIISTKLYSPSYISLEYALSYYGIIPDAVFEITAITTKTTRYFETKYGLFSYRKIKKSCFFGFETQRKNDFSYYFASIAKAMLDFLYLNSKKLKIDYQTWQDLRFQNLEKINFNLLKKFAFKFNQKKLNLLINNLEQYAKSN